MSKGGVHKLHLFGREKYIHVSKTLRPKRSLNARLGHSKVLTKGEQPETRTLSGTVHSLRFYADSSILVTFVDNFGAKHYGLMPSFLHYGSW